MIIAFCSLKNAHSIFHWICHLLTRHSSVNRSPTIGTNWFISPHNWHSSLLHRVLIMFEGIHWRYSCARYDIASWYIFDQLAQCLSIMPKRCLVPRTSSSQIKTIPTWSYGLSCLLSCLFNDWRDYIWIAWDFEETQTLHQTQMGSLEVSVTGELVTTSSKDWMYHEARYISCQVPTMMWWVWNMEAISINDKHWVYRRQRHQKTELTAWFPQQAALSSEQEKADYCNSASN